jgi:hypothetical protein
LLEDLIHRDLPRRSPHSTSCSIILGAFQQEQDRPIGTGEPAVH